ncbi:hypothetical protein KAU11_06555, partial [Candidatus Babeliales bacterium]|nr:hypothetical protein [Candidatus Babeliales bacterium]
MSLKLTTSNFRAFELLTNALRAIDRYYHGRSIRDVEQASSSIDDALAQDNDYGLAVYYKGVVLDLIGKPADAPKCFERILTECNERNLEIETRFNLGVAYYHQYSHQCLEQAKFHFEQVIEKARDAKLKHLAQAHLAQTHAMWMRPSYEQLPDKQMQVSIEVRQHIEHHFKECQALVAMLRTVKRKQHRLIATYENANGMSNMYYTDHVACEVSTRGSHLKIARDSLLTAEKRLPNDWANTCDLGSVELRLAILARDSEKPNDEIETNFSAGRDYLLRVVNDLRPGYGFALYELAHVCQLR